MGYYLQVDLPRTRIHAWIVDNIRAYLKIVQSDLIKNRKKKRRIKYRQVNLWRLVRLKWFDDKPRLRIRFPAK